MKFNKFKKKLLAGLLIVLSITNVLVPLGTNALDWSGSMGTNVALGSPLLNETSWTTEDWNVWEMVAFGNFLSNFPVPLVDDYMSAFQSNRGGSGGRGLDALKFSIAQDSQATKVLQNLLSFAITDQAQPLSKIKVRMHKIDDHLTDSLGKLESDDGRDAKLSDLFVKIGDGGDDESHIGKLKTKEVNRLWLGAISDQLRYTDEMVLPEFYITSNSKPETVLNFTDSYDFQIFAANISRASSTKWKDTVADNIKNLADQPLGLDVYGNICVQSNGRNIIVVPAAANQYLTKDKQYNFLTSTFLLDNYIDSAGNGMLYDFLSCNVTWAGITYYMGGGIVSAVADDNVAGKVIMFHDTDTYVFQYIKSLVEGGKSIESAIDEFADKGYEDIGYGKMITEMVDAQATMESISLPFKIETIGSDDKRNKIENIFKYGSNAESASIEAVNQVCTAANFVANWFPTNKNNKVLNKMFLLDGGSESQLFKDRTYYAPGTQYDVGILQYINYAVNYMDTKRKYNVNNEIYGVPTQADFRKRVAETKTFKQFNRAIYTPDAVISDDKIGSGDKVNGLYKHWLVNESGYKKGRDYNSSNVQNIEISDVTDTYWFMRPKTKLHLSGEIEYYNNAAYRIGGVYTINAAMRTASNVMNVKEGTEFATYTPAIYLTYLDWYGIVDGESKFKESMFKGDMLARTGDTIAEGAALDPEAKKDAITNYTYQLLDPNAGKEYRKTLINKFFTELAYDNYQKIVFGANDGSISSSLSSTSSEGFLKLHTLADNFLTGWVLDFYTKHFIAIFGVLLVLVFAIAVVGGKGIGFAFSSMFTLISLMTLSPSMGDIAPYICNRIVQKMFAENMTYWAVQEGIESTNIEAQFNGSNAEDAEVNRYIRMINLTQMDKTIMIKNDISKKIVEDINGVDFAQLQRLKTTRWLLPMLMRQISADDESANYVYTSLNDLYRNMDNLYWFYRSSVDGGDKIQLDMSNTSSEARNIADQAGVGDTGATNELNILSLTDKQSIYGGYYNSRGDTNSSNVNYRSLSRSSNEDNKNVHNTFYLLNIGTQFVVPNPLELEEIKNSGIGANGLTTEVWDKYAEIIKNNGENLGFVKALKTVNDDKILPNMTAWNSYEDPVFQSFGYLWTTETLAPYFYTQIRDTFPADMSVGGLIYELQGYYAPIADDEGNIIKEDAHHTFMRDGHNGEIRDFLDLEEVFTNVIPYMYNVQIIAGGNDDDTGAFGSELFGEDYPVYEKNKKSWLYRCNWVSKIAESRMYTKEQTIGYIKDDGTKAKATIKGGLHPTNYEQYRSMIFSEAQMVDMGLEKSDLSYVEHLILDINRDTERDWLLLINYANTNGMKPKVLYRQMAIDALLNFNRRMSMGSGNNINPSLALYPTTLDLRNMSFDAVMKLLMISANTNANSIRQDTMYTVIQNGDWIGGMLLLLDAIACSVVIPMIRDVGMALVFFLLLFGLVSSIFLRKTNKTKLLIGAMFIYAKYAIGTILFYSVFYFLISLSSPDRVLSAERIVAAQSHSTWFMFVFVLADVILYSTFLWLQIIKFVWDNKHDMGFEASMNMLGAVGNTIAGVGKGIGGVIRGTSSQTQEVFKDSQKVKNDKNDPLHVEGEGLGGSGDGEGKGGKNKSPYKGRNRLDNNPYDANNGYVNEKDAKIDYSSMTADQINKLIEDGKQRQSELDDNRSRAGKVMSGLRSSDFNDSNDFLKASKQAHIDYDLARKKADDNRKNIHEAQRALVEAQKRDREQIKADANAKRRELGLDEE